MNIVSNGGQKVSHTCRPALLHSQRSSLSFFCYLVLEAKMVMVQDAIQVTGCLKSEKIGEADHESFTIAKCVSLDLLAYHTTGGITK